MSLARQARIVFSAAHNQAERVLQPGRVSATSNTVLTMYSLFEQQKSQCLPCPASQWATLIETPTHQIAAQLLIVEHPGATSKFRSVYLPSWLSVFQGFIAFP